MKGEHVVCTATQQCAVLLSGPHLAWCCQLHTCMQSIVCLCVCVHVCVCVWHHHHFPGVVPSFIMPVTRSVCVCARVCVAFSRDCCIDACFDAQSTQHLVGTSCSVHEVAARASSLFVGAESVNMAASICTNTITCCVNPTTTVQDRPGMACRCLMSVRVKRGVAPCVWLCTSSLFESGVCQPLAHSASAWGAKSQLLRTNCGCC